MKIKEIRLPGQKKSRARTLLLLSGGLDSLLAGKVLEEQGVEIVGLTFESVFFDASRAVVAAEKLSWPLILAEITEEQIRIVEQPRYGYGRHLNPCIDCHGQMVKLAAGLLLRYEADFISTGEVLGERPMSQNRQALELVEKSGEARWLVLRPLSARLLPPTRPEELGLVNRQQLLDLSGRCRQRQIELARYYGLTDYPAPAGGCLLTDAVFAEKLKKLRDWRGEWRREDIDLIKLGRVFFEDEGLIIVGRDEEENKKLENTALASDLLLTLPDFKGPLAVVRFKNKDKDSLVLGKFGEEKGRETVEAGQSLEIFNRPLLKKAALLTIRYSRYRQTEEAAVILVSPFRAQSRNFKKEEWKPYL